MRVINYGGGTNSTALIIEAVKRGIPFDVAVFADTGSERPETYDYLATFGAWLAANTDAELTVVRWVRKRESKDSKGVRVAGPGDFLSLHAWCEKLVTLPSRSFGLSGCTSKWKQQPVDGFLKSHPAIVAEHTAGRTVERWIGYDADEPSRAARMLAKSPEPALWTWRAPLLDWDMGRDECVETIAAAGLPQPGKSACWFCPSSTKADIDRLHEEHPDLLARALRMESAAIKAGNVQTRAGLGGRLNWGDYVRGLDVPDLPPELACGCFDGD